MQIVINISDEMYFRMRDDVYSTYDGVDCLKAVKNGTPLPKNHGRLIDADLVSKQYGLDEATKYGNKDAEQQANSYSTMMMYEIADMIEDAPTIIPADGGD